MKENEELYADSAQARAEDRRRSAIPQRLDEFGNPVISCWDFCHEYDAEAEREREKSARASLKVRIEQTMKKMEMRLNAINERA